MTRVDATELGIPGRDWPIEARAGAVAGLLRRLDRQRRTE